MLGTGGRRRWCWSPLLAPRWCAGGFGVSLVDGALAGGLGRSPGLHVLAYGRQDSFAPPRLGEVRWFPPPPAGGRDSYRHSSFPQPSHTQPCADLRRGRSRSVLGLHGGAAFRLGDAGGLDLDVWS